MLRYTYSLYVSKIDPLGSSNVLESMSPAV